MEVTLAFERTTFGAHKSYLDSFESFVGYATRNRKSVGQLGSDYGCKSTKFLDVRPSLTVEGWLKLNEHYDVFGTDVSHLSTPVSFDLGVVLSWKRKSTRIWHRSC